MKVKVGDKIYSADEEPVMVILSDVDKLNILNYIRTTDFTKYCAAPDNLTEEEIRKFMET